MAVTLKMAGDLQDVGADVTMSVVVEWLQCLRKIPLRVMQLLINIAWWLSAIIASIAEHSQDSRRPAWLKTRLGG